MTLVGKDGDAPMAERGCMKAGDDVGLPELRNQSCSDAGSDHANWRQRVSKSMSLDRNHFPASDNVPEQQTDSALKVVTVLALLWAVTWYTMPERYLCHMRAAASVHPFFDFLCGESCCAHRPCGTFHGWYGPNPAVASLYAPLDSSLVLWS